MLELPMSSGGVERIMNLSLIVDVDHGLTVVDTALPAVPSRNCRCLTSKPSCATTAGSSLKMRRGSSSGLRASAEKK